MRGAARAELSREDAGMRVLIATAVEAERQAVTRATGPVPPTVVALPFGVDLHRVRLSGGPRPPGRLAGAERAGDLVGPRQQAAEPPRQRAHGGDVGTADEPHGAARLPADDECRVHRRQRVAPGVDDDERAGADRRTFIPQYSGTQDGIQQVE